MKAISLPLTWAAFLLGLLVADPDVFGDGWFALLAFAELSIIGVAVWAWSAASVPVISVGCVLLGMHVIGYAETVIGVDLYYWLAVPALELLQGVFVVTLAHKGVCHA